MVMNLQRIIVSLQLPMQWIILAQFLFIATLPFCFILNLLINFISRCQQRAVKYHLLDLLPVHQMLASIGVVEHSVSKEADHVINQMSVDIALGLMDR